MCGKVIGYQERTTDALSNHVRQHSIEGTYADGVSLTHGRNPHHHIWTFVSAQDESDSSGSTIIVCHCTNSLASRTTDEIELRMRRDELRSNEDVGLKSVELYVQ